MTDHRTPTATATSAINQTATVYTTRHHLQIFLILSCLIFSLHTNIDNFTNYLTTYIDQDTFIQSLFSQTHQTPKPKLNHSSFILNPIDPQMGLENFLSDQETKVNDITSHIFHANMTNNVKETKPKFFIRFDLEEDELKTLGYYVCGVFGSYVVIIIGFVFTHVWVHGVVFVVVVNYLLRKDCSVRGAFTKGAVLGSRRLYRFVLLRLVVRDGLSQLLAVYFFGDVKDGFSLFKIFVRVKVMPFSTVPPWIKGFDKEIYGFMLLWFLLDLLLSFVFALCTLVAMEDPARSIREVVEEGFRLLLLRINPAINLKSFEGIVCGSFVRHILTHIFGGVFASVVQSFMEVYFLVAWTMHYFAVRSMDANASRKAFGNTELKAMLHDT